MRPARTPRQTARREAESSPPPIARRRPPDVGSPRGRCASNLARRRREVARLARARARGTLGASRPRSRPRGAVLQISADVTAVYGLKIREGSAVPAPKSVSVRTRRRLTSGRLRPRRANAARVHRRDRPRPARRGGETSSRSSARPPIEMRWTTARLAGADRPRQAPAEAPKPEPQVPKVKFPNPPEVPPGAPKPYTTPPGYKAPPMGELFNYVRDLAATRTARAGGRADGLARLLARDAVSRRRDAAHPPPPPSFPILSAASLPAAGERKAPLLALRRRSRGADRPWCVGAPRGP